MVNALTTKSVAVNTHPQVYTMESQIMKLKPVATSHVRTASVHHFEKSNLMSYMKNMHRK